MVLSGVTYAMHYETNICASLASNITTERGVGEQREISRSKCRSNIRLTLRVPLRATQDTQRTTCHMLLRERLAKQH
jgi:hypothetical protein